MFCALPVTHELSLFGPVLQSINMLQTEDRGSIVMQMSAANTHCAYIRVVLISPSIACTLNRLKSGRTIRRVKLECIQMR